MGLFLPNSNFDLRLVPDDTIFHEDAVIENHDGDEHDKEKITSHIYHGSLYGKIFITPKQKIYC